MNLGLRQSDSSLRTYLRVLILLISSRLVVILGIIFSARFLAPSPLSAGEVNLPWYQYLLRWDAGWYLQIVNQGYSYNGDDSIQQSVGFQPLYPMVCKAVAFVFHIPNGIALIVVANLLTLIAIPLFFKLVREEFGDAVAIYAVAALCFFPGAIFFTAGYAESLAFLVTVGMFLMLKRRRYFLAAVFTSLALATRPHAIVLLLPFLFELWRSYAKDLRGLLKTGIPCLLLATSGLWLHMIYLGVAFGHPLAFVTARRAWQGPASWRQFFEVITLQPFRHLLDIWRDGPLPETLAPWVFLVSVLLFIFFRKRLPASYALFTFGSLLLPYVMFSGNLGFAAFTRYLLMVFPIFIILGHIFQKRVALGIGVIGAFAALLFMHAALFAQSYWAG